MPVKKQSDEITADIEAIRTELALIGQRADASEEEIQRGQDLMTDLDDKEKELDKAVKREEDLDNILRASRKPNRVDQAFPGGPGGRRSPELMRKTDPYTEETFEELKRSLYNGGAERA